jgi:hypothetical protein
MSSGSFSSRRDVGGRSKSIPRQPIKGHSGVTVTRLDVSRWGMNTRPGQGFLLPHRHYKLQEGEKRWR